ncbi:MAG TPA: TrmH family RNA methyltransferase [Mycobacteriales bacterium]|nr:TrmH family RNA methyltransferase [Mycobacteriales bacterium]
MTVVLEGFHAVKHALRFAPSLVRGVTVVSRVEAGRLCAELAPDVAEALLALAVEGAVEHPTGVTGTADRPGVDDTCLSRRSAPLVLLDHPRHPGNAGAVVRVAAAAGASGVALLGDLDPWHPAVVRGSAGLHYALPVLRCALEQVTGTVVALDADGEPWTGLPDDAVLAVGSERAGLSAEVRGRADKVVALPMRAGVSSLNLATAVSAALYAWRLAPGSPHA